VREEPSIPTRSSLLGRLKNWQDETSWEFFAQVYGKLIRDFTLKAGLTLDEADEVVQEVLIELADRLKTFSYDRKKGSFKGWLFQLASWRVTNQLKRRQHSLTSLDAMPTADACVAPHCIEASLHDVAEAAWEQEWQQAMLGAALKKLRERMPHKHYQVLQMIVQQGLTVVEVGRLLDIPRTQVYLLKFRGLARLKRQITILEKGQF
jgi:RNA polymerase sigma factor (sigma-70 family)